MYMHVYTEHCIHIYLDPTRAVLHVDPVVAGVPEALNAEVAVRVQGVCLPRGGLDEEALGHLPLP